MTNIQRWMDCKLDEAVAFVCFDFWFSQNRYTVFGHVIHGLETLEKMEKTPTDKGDRPVRQIIIRRVTIHANPFAN